MILAISGKKGSGKDTVGKIIQGLIAHYIYGEITKGKIIEFVEGNIILDNKQFQIKKFADKLKDIVCLLINCTREQLEDETFKNTELGEEWWYYKELTNGLPLRADFNPLIPYSKDVEVLLKDKGLIKLIKPTPRLLLQLSGTECGRSIIHPNIWVNSLFSNYGARETSLEKSNGFVSIGKEKVPVKFPNWIITDMRFPNELEAVKKRDGISIRVNRGKTELYEQMSGTIENLIPTGIFKEHESETALDNAEFDYVIDNYGTIKELIEKVKEILIKEKII